MEDLFEENGYRCQRCGYYSPPNIRKKKHLSVTEIKNEKYILCNLCETIFTHKSIPDKTPTFPKQNAPAPVAKMKKQEHHQCSRCGRNKLNPNNIVLHTKKNNSLCVPCAYLLMRQDIIEMSDLTSNHLLKPKTKTNIHKKAPIFPARNTPISYDIERPPHSLREKIAYFILQQWKN